MKRTNFPKRKLQRQEEAVARQQAYSNLSLEAKLAQITARPGESAKEVKKLTRVIVG